MLKNFMMNYQMKRKNLERLKLLLKKIVKMINYWKQEKNILEMFSKIY